MPELAKLVETLDEENMHRDFKLWLTSAPSNIFPVQVLQNGIKLVVESSAGIKQMMMNNYARMSDELFDSSRDPTAYRNLV